MTLTLLRRWPLNETDGETARETLSGLDDALTGFTAGPAKWGGAPDYGLDMGSDGTNRYLVGDHHADLVGLDVSVNWMICCWLKAPFSLNDKTYASWGDSTAADPRIKIANQFTSLQYSSVRNGAGTEVAQDSGVETFADDTWRWSALAMNGTAEESQWYKGADGVAVSTDGAAQAYVAALSGDHDHDQFTIGVNRRGSGPTISEPFRGLLRDLRVYLGVPASTAELDAIKDAPIFDGGPAVSKGIGIDITRGIVQGVSG